MEKYIDRGVELFLDITKGDSQSGIFGINYKSADIKNILSLFDEDQLIQGLGDGIFYCYALLDDGRLLSFKYRYDDINKLIHVDWSFIDDCNNCIIQTIKFPEYPKDNYIQILNENGEVIVGPILVSKYLSIDINCPIQEIMKPVSMEQLKARGFTVLNRDDFANDIVYQLATLLQSGEGNGMMSYHDENMEQAGIFKIFNEDQMIYTKSDSGIETCWGMSDNNVICIKCVPPKSNNGKNMYCMTLCPNVMEYFLEIIKKEDGRTSIQVTDGNGKNFYSDETPTYLEIPRDLNDSNHIFSLIKQITFDEILERSKKSIEK